MNGFSFLSIDLKNSLEYEPQILSKVANDLIDFYNKNKMNNSRKTRKFIIKDNDWVYLTGDEIDELDKNKIEYTKM